MPQYQFETHAPVDLYVEFGKGNLNVRFTETTESTIAVEGRGAEEVVVEQHGDELRIQEPRRTGLFRDNSLRIDVVVPALSNPAVRTGSADVQLQGSAGHGQLRSGSGDLSAGSFEGHVLVESGSGDIRIDDLRGDTRIKTGSGDVAVGNAGGALNVSTGSGDVRVDTTGGTTVVKTGSGDLHVGASHADVSATTGSGDVGIGKVHRGRVSAKGASGDVKVGVSTGVPVWTDVTTVTGDLRSDLQGAGQPQEGQDHIEVRVKTVTGDVVLTEA